MIYSGINERARGLRGRERVVASSTASLRGSVRGGDTSPRLGEKGSTEHIQRFPNDFSIELKYQIILYLISLLNKNVSHVFLSIPCPSHFCRKLTHSLSLSLTVVN